nr:immunity protein YezG family protein [Paenibacillus odorifer]
MSVNKTEELYQLIGNKLIGIIPDEWSKIYLYAEILPGSRIIYFYLESNTKKELIYSHSIPKVYGVDELIYDRLCRELQEYFVELNEGSRGTLDQAWTNLTMNLDSSGKFNIDYNYDEVVFNPSKQRTIWKYKVLGLLPTDEFHQVYLDEYLNNKLINT